MPMVVNPGFRRKRKKDSRLPPGQYQTRDFPVLSLGPTPQVSTAEWKLKVFGHVENQLDLTWEDIHEFPLVEVTADIHCVTKWSKFGTRWSGVTLDELLRKVGVKPEVTHLIAYSYDNYSTNLPIEDVRNAQGLVALYYDGKPIPPEHGGPARLLVPHLYFWKSAKWLKGIELTDSDQPGFWETRGYHNYGDPWKEQRYS
jgi:DMSO/TMAO reductase YedYZ molybdopterin-dependent catalytic subunit